MQNAMNPMLDLAISTLRLDDAPSADGVHLSDEQKLSLLETVWESIPYEVFDEMLKKADEMQKK